MKVAPFNRQHGHASLWLLIVLGLIVLKIVVVVQRPGQREVVEKIIEVPVVEEKIVEKTVIEIEKPLHLRLALATRPP